MEEKITPIKTEEEYYYPTEENTIIVTLTDENMKKKKNPADMDILITIITPDKKQALACLLNIQEFHRLVSLTIGKHSDYMRKQEKKDSLNLEYLELKRAQNDDMNYMKELEGKISQRQERISQISEEMDKLEPLRPNQQEICEKMGISKMSFRKYMKK